MTIKTLAREGTPFQRHAELVTIAVPEDAELLKRHITALQAHIGFTPAQTKTGAFTGKVGQTMLLPVAGSTGGQILAVGIGKKDICSLETLRRAAASAVKAAASIRARTLALVEPDKESFPRGVVPVGHDHATAVAGALTEGALLAAYRFDKYKAIEPDSYRGLVSLTVVTGYASRLPGCSRGVREATVVCEAAWLARDLSNAPGNEIYPETLASRAKKSGRRSGFRVRVLGEHDIEKLKMGGLLGVARGSFKPPRFIIMDYAPRGRSQKLPTVVLVGKGITFDSGGISIKPSANMAEMKMDMSGAAVVIATMQAAASLKLPVHLVGLVPAAENLPGGNALKPGDIIRHLNGKTSEIDNTDAEGRLVLADALAYAQRYAPGVVIDLATLTGAVVVALGHEATGMLGTSRTAMNLLRTAGETTYERVWELPLFEEYERHIKSDVADVKNVGGRWGGAITAAMFLKHFVGSTPWVHLDIAGTAMIEEAGDYVPRGASGVGVRLLVEFLRYWKG